MVIDSLKPAFVDDTKSTTSKIPVRTEQQTIGNIQLDCQRLIHEMN